jgi:hypothetical protein
MEEVIMVMDAAANVAAVEVHTFSLAFLPRALASIKQLQPRRF